jgi:hypothetical protein
LHGFAPPANATLLPDAVISVDAVLKMNTAFGSPWALRVTVPVITKVPATESYTPGIFVEPPSSVATVVAGVRPPASL